VKSFDFWPLKLWKLHNSFLLNIPIRKASTSGLLSSGSSSSLKLRAAMCQIKILDPYLIAGPTIAKALRITQSTQTPYFSQPDQLFRRPPRSFIPPGSLSCSRTFNGALSHLPHPNPFLVAGTTISEAPQAIHVKDLFQILSIFQTTGECNANDLGSI